jgi:hypothetical protein
MDVKPNKLIAAGLIFLLGHGWAALASSVMRQVNVEQLTADAPRIFLGKCLSVRSGVDEHKLPATFYTFQVARVFKGAVPLQVTIKQFGGNSASPEASVLRFDGMPAYEPGESYLLFLGEDSKLGFTSPQGLSQGAFHAFRDPATNRLAVENGVQNRGLFNDLKRTPGLGLHASAGGKSQDAGGPLFLDDFSACIAQLLKK